MLSLIGHRTPQRPVCGAARPPRARRAAATAFAAVLLLAPATAPAQTFEFHGLLDLAQTQRGDAYELNVQSQSDTPYAPWRLRLFAEGTISPRVGYFTQAVLRDPPAVYIEGAYIVLTPQLTRDMHLEAGKIPWPIGTYAARSYSDKNPFMGKPLMYQYHSTLYWYSLPASADALIGASGSGQGVYGPNGYTHMGMPVVDDGYWDTGAAFTGSARPLEYAIGMTNGTPGWGNVVEDENHGKTVLGRAGLQALPGLRFGASGAYGPYMMEALNPKLPVGKTADDYHQKLVMVDGEWLMSRIELRTEGYANAWENPTLGDLGVRGGYLEGQVTVMPGVVVAQRGELMRFSNLTNSLGQSLPWDYNRDRYETALCYRPERDLRFKGSWQRNVQRTPAEPTRVIDLYAVGISLSF